MNEKPYTTAVKFLTRSRFEALPEMTLGCKVAYDENRMKLAEYLCEMAYAASRRRGNYKITCYNYTV